MPFYILLTMSDTVIYTVEITYTIIGHEHYVFDKLKNLHNKKTGRIIKQKSKNGMIGYYINGKFMSTKRLKPLLIKPPKNILPF